MADDQPPIVPPRNPTIESLQNDINTGNSYRMEVLKTMVTLATGLLAFTVAFRPTIEKPKFEWLMFWSWGLLALSIVCGIGVMHRWEHFYLSYRKDWKGKTKEGEDIRDRLWFWIKAMFCVQFISFAFGVMGVAIFAGQNLQYAAPVLPTSPTPAKV